MRFEIIDSKGLSRHTLAGIIGESIIPAEYEIDQDGNIHIESRIVPAQETAWDSSNNCVVLTTTNAINIFMGHAVKAFRVKQPFEMFNPVWLRLHETTSPK